MHALNGRPFAFVLVMVVLAVSSALGLAAMSGWARNLAAPPLSATMTWSDFPLPQGFGVEPQTVSDFLVSEMQSRALSDVALRITLGNDGRQKLHDIVIPRLVSASIIREMIADVQPLSDVLAVGRFKSSAQITVMNAGDAPLDDVAITVPGALRAENAAGGAEAVLFPDADTQAISLGTLAANDEKTLTVWFDRPADFSAEARNQFKLGATDGQDGIIYVHGARNWAGADLEVLPWARWLVAALLAAICTGALLALAIMFAPGLFRKKSPVQIAHFTD